MALSLPSSLSSSSSSYLSLHSYRNSPSNSSIFTISTPKSLHFTTSHSRFHRGRRSLRPDASLAVDSPTASGINRSEESRKLILEVNDLTAVISESKQEILRGINLSIYEGEVHAVMGRNGSGKSTFSKVLVGHPDYEVTGGSVVFKGENLLGMEPEERAHAGLFMSFQSPVEIPGVSNMDFLRMAVNSRRAKSGLPELGPIEFFGFLSPKLAAVNMNPSLLDRNVNEGFSGGEKKRNEILQLAVLEADLAILDEIDSGLDVDALQDVAKAVNGLLTPKNAILMITHYQRLLDYIKPTYVHIMEDGRIVRTGDFTLAKQLEKEGYKAVSAA
ncbi:non-intrinsic ABC protein 7 [Tasmannia lanceolata]|uniref:non-intrinsic ABC protein 7 n=1 Tax=Tasmannia lanceolata TaxID=3420 RepID=UPI0040640887